MSQPTPEAAQLVKQLMEQPGNNMCADCQRKISKWASTTLGIFICIDCSGIHRNLGTHISFVRSCTLDSWTPEQARVMKRVGNERANEYWEARLPPEFIRPSTADRAGMEYFIRQKYVNKCWAADGDPPQFRTAARTGGRSNVRPSINMYNGYFQHNPMAQPQPPTNQTIISANARKTLSVSRSNDNLESVRKPAHKSASMGLADFMNMMNQAQTQSDDTDDVSDNNSNNNSIPPQSPVAQQNDFYNHPPPPSPIQPVTTPQATTTPSPIQPVATPQAAAGTSPAQHSQLKSNPLPKPKSSPPQQQPQQAYPTTGSTAHDIMAAAQNDPGKGKRGKKGVARFMKRPSNDAVFDQMLKMSENSCRPESAPVIQAPPQ